MSMDTGKLDAVVKIFGYLDALKPKQVVELSEHLLGGNDMFLCSSVVLNEDTELGATKVPNTASSNRAAAWKNLMEWNSRRYT